MATYDIRALHARILKILLTIDAVCKEHHLHYSIWAGTMLGAVRHGGFIPWDDDVDIAMPRPDYDLLAAHAAEWLPAPYEFVCAETDPAYPLPFGKIQDADTTLIERLHLRYLGGVYIDVFPIDGVPQNKMVKRWQFARYEYYKRVLYLLFRDPYKHGRGPSSWVPLLCRRLYTLQAVQQKIRNILTRYPLSTGKEAADYDDGMHFCFPKTWLDTPTTYLFEGKPVQGIAQAQAYLSMKYGNFMTLPSTPKRRQHNFHYLDLTHSYHDGTQANLP